MPSNDIYSHNQSVRSSSKGLALNEMSYYNPSQTCVQPRSNSQMNDVHPSHILKPSNGYNSFMNGTQGHLVQGFTNVNLSANAKNILPNHVRSYEPTISQVPEEPEVIREDLEAHYIYANRIAGRSHTQNSRPPHQHLLRTIDDIPSRYNAAGNVLLSRDFKDSVDERQRIFEDEIIKRIKILQNFTKGLDQKLKKVLGTNIQSENIPVRLNTVSNNVGISDDKIKEHIKWELETLEKKQDDRVSRIENQIKNMKKQSDENTKAIMEETSSELETLKNEMGQLSEHIFNQITIQLIPTVEKDIKKQNTDLANQLREEFQNMVGSGQQQVDSRLGELEKMSEDLRLSQEQMLEEINKYQDNIEKVIDQQQNEFQDNISRMFNDIDQLRAQVKKDHKNDNMNQYITADYLNEQLDDIRNQISGKEYEGSQTKILEKQIQSRIEDIESKLSKQKGMSVSQSDLDVVENDLKNKINDLRSQIDNVQSYTLDNKQSFKQELVQYQKYTDDKIKAIESRQLTSISQIHQSNNLQSSQYQPQIIEEESVQDYVQPLVSSTHVVKKNSPAKTFATSSIRNQTIKKEEDVFMDEISDIEDDFQYIPGAHNNSKATTDYFGKNKQNDNMLSNQTTNRQTNVVSTINKDADGQSTIQHEEVYQDKKPVKSNSSDQQVNNKHSKYGLQHEDDIFEDEEWDFDIAAVDNVESMIDKFIDHQVSLLVKEQESHQTVQQKSSESRPFSFY